MVISSKNVRIASAMDPAVAMYPGPILIKRLLILAISALLISCPMYCRDAGKDDPLEYIPGKTGTYYAAGCSDKAEYLQKVLEDAAGFYEAMLNDTFSLELFVLDRRAWKRYAEEPFPLPHIITDKNRIIMPANSYYKMRLPAGDSVYGKDHYFYSDFLTIHELGHYIANHLNARSYPAWSGEFFADFIQIAYMHEMIPDFNYDNAALKLFPWLPLRYKSLEDFGVSGIINGLVYHAKFQELSDRLYLKYGFDFMFKYMQLYQVINKYIEEGKYENVTVTNEMIYQNSIHNIRGIAPDVFEEWNRSMKQTFHSWVILYGLVLFIGPFMVFM